MNLEDRLPDELSVATGLAVEGPRDPHVKPPGSVTVQRIALKPEGNHVVLWVWPAELKPQALAFYGDPRRVDALHDLAARPDWSAAPNGHVSYRLAAPERRWYFQDGSLGLAAYLRTWQEHLDRIGGHRRDALRTELWPWLSAVGLAGDGDRPLMEDFLDRAPGAVHLRPGVRLGRRWSRSEAEALDQAGRLRPAVREAVDIVLDTLDEPPLPACS